MGFLALLATWLETIQALVSIKRGLQLMLDVEEKMHQLVCLQGEREREMKREREREREQQKEGGALSLEDAVTTSSLNVTRLHSKLFHLLIDQPVETRNKPLMPDEYCSPTTTGRFKWRLRRVHTPAAIWRLLHNILVAQEKRGEPADDK